ncbi:MAG: permease [Phycisphaerae bacterium]
MSFRNHWKKLLLLAVVFLAAYWLPVGSGRFDGAVLESLHLLREYAREHVLLCLVPAFFIAGAISVFLSKASVMKYLGAGASKLLAYSVASVSGGVLAVCSCTVLPLFSGIYRMGAGLGPATTFLYSGPAINVLAIILTAAVLGPELGIARAVGAVVFGIVIGLMMHVLFIKEERRRQVDNSQSFVAGESTDRPLWQNAVLLASMVGVLVFANWAEADGAGGFWAAVASVKWVLTGASVAVLAGAVIAWLNRGDLREWVSATWSFAVQILPLLFAGVLVAGLLLGRPGHDGLIPSQWIASAVGGNSLRANAVASVAGALMYFATLTEVPILQGLIGSGMGKGPALALLLAGPAVSLPNLLVIRSVMGTKKTIVYVLLVVVMATASGMIFGTFFQEV